MGAENRHHPPRPRPRETLLPCRHAASPRPSMGGAPLQGRVQPKAKVGRAERGGRDPLLWPLALRSKASPAGRAGLRAGGGAGRRSLSQGTLMPPSPGRGGGGGPSQAVGGVSVQLQGRAAHVWCPGVPAAEPAHLHGLGCPVPAHLQARPGQRPGAAADGMYDRECSWDWPCCLRLRPSGAAWARGSSPAPAPVGFW